LKQLVLGIDGGGTTTRAALVSDEGVVLARGEAGPANFHAAGTKAAVDNIRLSVTRAFQNAGRQVEPCSAAFLGIAGVRTASERALIFNLISELNLAPAANVEVDHDLRIALAGGLRNKEGIVLIAGTGSACYARRDNGREWIAGGWGYIMDDLGSSYDVSRRALAAVVRAADGRAQQTVLTGTVLAKLNLQSTRDLVHRVHGSASFAGKPLTRSELAALAPLVLDAAAQGDGPAQSILKRCVTELALLAQTVAAKTDFSTPPVVVSGGLFTSAFFRQNLTAALGVCVPGCKVSQPQLDPVFGAALLALQSLKVPMLAQILERLDQLK